MFTIGTPANESNTGLLTKELVKLIEQGNLRAAEAAVHAGANVNGHGTETAKPILVAAVCGRPRMIEFLVARGADVEVESRNILYRFRGKDVFLSKGSRPLHVAVHEQGVEALRALLKSGAKPDTVDEHGATPLMYTCRDDEGKHWRAGIARELLEAGADPAAGHHENGQGPLHFAAHNGHVEIVDMILKKAPLSLTTRDDKNRPTPLDAAVLGKQRGTTSQLLAAGATSTRIPGPLFVAVQDGHKEMVRLLLEQGLEAIGGPTHSVPYAIYQAILENQASIVHLLLGVEGEERRGRWAQGSYSGIPFFEVAVAYACDSVVPVLLAEGADERGTFDIIGSSAKDRKLPIEKLGAKIAAIRRTLMRGQAFRSQSWAWETAATQVTDSDGDADRGVTPSSHLAASISLLRVRVLRARDRQMFMRSVVRYVKEGQPRKAFGKVIGAVSTFVALDSFEHRESLIHFGEQRVP